MENGSATTLLDVAYDGFTCLLVRFCDYAEVSVSCFLANVNIDHIHECIHTLQHTLFLYKRHPFFELYMINGVNNHFGG